MNLLAAAVTECRMDWTLIVVLRGHRNIERTEISRLFDWEEVVVKAVLYPEMRLSNTCAAEIEIRASHALMADPVDITVASIASYAHMLYAAPRKFHRREDGKISGCFNREK
jgi:hypothetical protein